MAKFSSSQLINRNFVEDLIDLEQSIEPFSYKIEWGISKSPTPSSGTLFHTFGLEACDSANMSSCSDSEISSSNSTATSTDSYLADLFSELHLSPNLDKISSLIPEQGWVHQLRLSNTLAETQLRLLDSNCQLIASRNEFSQLESDLAIALLKKRDFEKKVQELECLSRSQDNRISQLTVSLDKYNRSNSWDFNAQLRQELLSLRIKLEVNEKSVILSKDATKKYKKRNDELEKQIATEVDFKLQLQSSLIQVRSILSVEDIGDVNLVLQSLVDLNELVDEFAFEYSNLLSSESKFSKFTPKFLEIVEKHSNLSSAGFMLTRAKFRVSQTVDNLILPIIASAIISELHECFQVFSPALFVVDGETDLKLRSVFSEILSKDPRQALYWRRLTLQTLNQLHLDDCNTLAERSCTTVLSSLQELANYFDRSAELWTSSVWQNLSKKLLTIFQNALSWQKQHQEGYLSCRFNTFMCESGSAFDERSMEVETEVEYKKSVVIASIKLGLLQITHNSKTELSNSRILLKSVVLASGRNAAS